MGGFSSAPQFTSRVPIQFLSQDQPSLSITASTNSLLNNPKQLDLVSGTTAQLSQGIDGLNYLQGDGEYAPYSIQMQWLQLGYTDYLKMAALRPYYIDFISYRNIGYYGKLITDGIRSGGVKTQDVLKVNATFLVLAPSDYGGSIAVNRIANPTTLAVVNSATTNSGYIGASVAQYYWLTFSSIYGETLPQAVGPITNTHNNTYNDITWTWPSSTAYCTKASIYVSNVSTASSSRLLGEVPNGLTAQWRDYVGFASTLVNKQPPSASKAYRGSWCLGKWINEA